MTSPSSSAGLRAAALYLDMAGLDTAPGEHLLRAAGVEVLHAVDEPSAALLERVVALLVGYDRVDARWLDRLPALRLVATHSAGFDMVDTAAASARQVWVTNLPAAATEEVAVHALAMALALLRRLTAFDRDVKQGAWDSGAFPPPRVPADMTCGVLGMGHIGRRFAELARPLFGRMLACDPMLPDSAWPTGVERLELAEVLGRSDCVSLHLPLTDATTTILGAETLALLPPGAIIVNVSRGRLVDEQALLAALRSGHLAGVASDVLAQEPPDPQDPMLADDRVLLSPHVGYLSPGSLRRYAEVPARNVVALLECGAPLHPVHVPTGISPGRKS